MLTQDDAPTLIQEIALVRTSAPEPLLMTSQHACSDQRHPVALRSSQTYADDLRYEPAGVSGRGCL